MSGPDEGMRYLYCYRNVAMSHSVRFQVHAIALMREEIAGGFDIIEFESMRHE